MYSPPVRLWRTLDLPAATSGFDDGLHIAFSEAMMGGKGSVIERLALGIDDVHLTPVHLHRFLALAQRSLIHKTILLGHRLSARPAPLVHLAHLAQVRQLLHPFIQALMRVRLAPQDKMPALP